MVHKNETLGQLIYIFLLGIAYFTFAALVRTGLKNPFLLTLQFNKLVIGSLLNFLIVVFFLYYLGKALGGKGTFRNVLLSWSYTLIPTLIWFFATSILYILIPPPRTMSLSGKLFSVFYVGFSIALLYWKIILYYLSLRFALKLDLLKITLISAIFSIYIAAYGVIMYRLGIFRIPFI